MARAGCYELGLVPIWRLPAFRISRFMSLVVRHDLRKITRVEPKTAEQLEAAVDSIGANISEGYSKLHGRERARFYEHALCSARESREWYATSAPIIGKESALERARLLTRAIKILTVAVPQERAGSSEKRIRDAADRKRALAPAPAPAPNSQP